MASDVHNLVGPQFYLQPSIGMKMLCVEFVAGSYKVTEKLMDDL